MSFDRSRLAFLPLSARTNRVVIERDRVDPSSRAHSGRGGEAAAAAALAVAEARERRASVVLAFGAHAVKNGLAPVIIRLIEEGHVTHLATNGAAIIHDWEFAYQGESSEDVGENLAAGRFGLWEETGRFLSLAIAVGAYEGRGYGESVGALVETDGLTIPGEEELLAVVRDQVARSPERAAAAADLLSVLRRGNLPAGRLPVPHPHKHYGLQAAAYRLGVPYTAHPMFGHDIIYSHPLCLGAAVGRTAERDFLRFVASIGELDGGVYLSVGSAVMSPMIFEKALSMTRNVAHQEGRRIEDFRVFVVDLAGSSWDWQAGGEPPPDNPAYYQRTCKTFHRAGGTLTYVQADNRDFLPALARALGLTTGGGA